MSNVYTLETLKNDLDREFAPVVIEVDGERLVLRNLLRVNETERAMILEALKEVETSNSDDDEADLSVEEMQVLTSAVTNVLRSIVADGKGDKLVNHIDGDLMLSMKVLEMWTEATQPGEAQNSPA